MVAPTDSEPTLPRTREIFAAMNGSVHAPLLGEDIKRALAKARQEAEQSLRRYNASIAEIRRIMSLGEGVQDAGPVFEVQSEGSSIPSRPNPTRGTKLYSRILELVTRSLQDGNGMTNAAIRNRVFQTFASEADEATLVRTLGDVFGKNARRIVREDKDDDTIVRWAGDGS